MRPDDLVDELLSDLEERVDQVMKRHLCQTGIGEKSCAGCLADYVWGKITEARGRLGKMRLGVVRPDVEQITERDAEVDHLYARVDELLAENARLRRGLNESQLHEVIATDYSQIRGTR